MDIEKTIRLLSQMSAAQMRLLVKFDMDSYLNPGRSAAAAKVLLRNGLITPRDTTTYSLTDDGAALRLILLGKPLPKEDYETQPEVETCWNCGTPLRFDGICPSCAKDERHERMVEKLESTIRDRERRIADLEYDLSDANGKIRNLEGDKSDLQYRLRDAESRALDRYSRW